MGPLYPQGRFPLSRVEIISSKPLPARGLMGPSLPVVPAPSRCASGCQSGVAAGCLASPSRRRGPPGLPVCRSGCAGPAAVACPLPPPPLRGPGTMGCCSGLSSLRIEHSRCCPAVALAKRGVARAGSGAAVPPLAGACITWASPSCHDQNVLGRNSPAYGNGATVTGQLHRMAIQPCSLSRSAGEPTGRASIHTAGTAPGS